MHIVFCICNAVPPVPPDDPFEVDPPPAPAVPPAPNIDPLFVICNMSYDLNEFGITNAGSVGSVEYMETPDGIFIKALCFLFVLDHPLVCKKVYRFKLACVVKSTVIVNQLDNPLILLIIVYQKDFQIQINYITPKLIFVSNIQ